MQIFKQQFVTFIDTAVEISNSHWFPFSTCNTVKAVEGLAKHFFHCPYFIIRRCMPYVLHLHPNPMFTQKQVIKNLATGKLGLG